MAKSIEAINAQVIGCRRCPRLVAWREKVAREKVRRFAAEQYWGKPLPGFGDSQARLLIIGLAPAAHGANRTGRMFTGDRSGDWLYRALHRAGYANQAEATAIDDGLILSDCYIGAVCHCAPPANKPTKDEFENCAVYLQSHLRYFTELWQQRQQGGAILCLGGLAYTHTLRALQQMDFSLPRPRPAFGHCRSLPVNEFTRIITSYHPSQQNTFTGKLTEPMFDAVFDLVKSE